MDIKKDTLPSDNRDPITGTPGAHPVGVGIGAAVGGLAAGAAAGTLAAGPVGTVVGAAVGAVMGGLGGSGGRALRPNVGGGTLARELRKRTILSARNVFQRLRSRLSRRGRSEWPLW